MIGWFFAKTGYYMFYAMSYKIEHTYNKWIKIANMLVIFINAIFICYALFNHQDEKQYELGYLTIFIICTLLILNVLLTLNPIQREEADDMYTRSCCSGQNIMMTVSVLFCLKVLELHNFLVASPQQKQVFYRPFHMMLAAWIFALWLNLQKIPERFFPNTPFIQKYLSSDVIKSITIATAVIVMNLLLRDAFMQVEVERLQKSAAQQ